MKVVRLTVLAENTVFKRYLRAEHGLSIYVEMGEDAFLFDTGASELFFENAKNLDNVVLEKISFIVLSHRHWDHTGGLLKALDFSRRVIAHPKVAEYVGEPAQGIPFTSEKLKRKGVEWDFKKDFEEIYPGVYFTGQVPRRKMAQFYSFPDDSSLVIDTSRGVALICGCCHAGIVNVLDYVKNVLNKKTRFLIGGLHLFRLSQNELEELGGFVKDYLTDDFRIYLSHCSGTQALSVWSRMFGGRVSWLSTGETLTL